VPSDLLKRRIGDVAAFLIPLALVKVAAVAIGKGVPPGARGAVVASAPIEPIELDFSTSSASLTPEQIAAAQHLDALAVEPFGAAPFYYRIRPQNDSPIIVDPGDNPDVDAHPSITVQMIMAGRGGGSALINGKPYKVGDVVDRMGGWRLVEVDGESYSVVLEDPRSGQRRHVKVEGRH
jgi:hypothetical protein